MKFSTNNPPSLDRVYNIDPNVVLLLAQRQRRWLIIKTTLGQPLVFAGWRIISMVSIVGSLRDREVACSASDRQGSNFESCVWRTVSSQSSHHPQEVLLAQFSLYVHKGGLKPDSFHFYLWRISKQTREMDPPLFQCWTTVFDAGPTLRQYLMNVLNKWLQSLLWATYIVTAQ